MPVCREAYASHFVVVEPTRLFVCIVAASGVKKLGGQKLGSCDFPKESCKFLTKKIMMYEISILFQYALKGEY